MRWKETLKPTSKLKFYIPCATESSTTIQPRRKACTEDVAELLDRILLSFLLSFGFVAILQEYTSPNNADYGY